MKQTCLCVFAKAPIQGKVKTRLFPALTEQQACEVHKKLLQHCVVKTRHADWQSQLWTTDTEHPYMLDIARQHLIPLYLQQGDELGERMKFSVSKILETSSYVIIIGADCPELDSNYISEAIKHLRAGVEVVLGPAEDGGYVLIGLSRNVDKLFENMQWGTHTVLAITRQRLQQANISWHELATLRDIDRPEDLGLFNTYLG